MAIYFPNQVPSTGQKSGEAFAGGIGNALNMLAQHKVNLMQERHQQARQQQQQHGLGQALESLGIPAQVAMLPESVQQAFIKQHLAQPQQQAFAEALSGLLGGEQQQMAPAQEQGQIAPQLQQVLGQQQQPQQQMQQAQISSAKIPAGLNPQQALQLAQLGLQKQALSKKDIAEQRKQQVIQQREERKQGFAEERESNKQTKEYYDKVLSEAEGAKKGDLRLNRMEHLIEKGSLPYSTTYKLLKNLSEAKFGAALPIVGPLAGLLVNPVLHSIGETGQAIQRNITARDTEEFEKLSNDFVRDAKTIFGARITDKDLEVFQSMIPTLMASDRGKKAVIRNMKSFNEASKIKSDVMKKIIKNNNNKRPSDLAILVEEQSAPMLDKIAQKFRSGLPTEELQEEAAPSQQLFSKIPSGGLF